MTESKDKYAVVADGVVVDTEPTKRAAAEVAKAVEGDVKVVPVDKVEEAKAETKPEGDGMGIVHLR